MTLDITVRGTAQQQRRAERATVSLAIALDGPDKQQVFNDTVDIQEPLTAQLRELVELHAVDTWSSDQLRISSHRPWSGDGARTEPVHDARVSVRAEFTDFERLGAFLDQWSGVEGVEVGEIAWDVTAERRQAFEAESRKQAVNDAVTKAQAYADALRRGKVVAVHIADRGMLPGSGELPPPGVFAAAKLGRSDGAGAGLDLTPDEIVIRVEVDVHFRAD